jgi:hypothetical protein
MGEIRVDPGSLRSAGGVAETAGADLRGLAGEVSAALAGVGAAAPAQTSGAATAFSSAMQTGALAIGDGVSALGANAGTAASVYEHVDREAMPR